jgi:hypothetical protein
MSSRIVVVDVGTHKGQEVRLLADRSVTWRRAIFFALLRHHRGIGNAWREAKAIALAQDVLSAKQFRFALVEPVLHPEIMDSLRLPGPVLFIKGVTSAAPAGEVVLRLAKAGDLGHSIIATKPNLSNETLTTYNFDFRTWLPWLLRSFDVAHDDIVILRMNAEGVEQGIIEWLTDDPIAKGSIHAVMGSTGDIKKCFGKDAEQAAQNRLAAAGIPFIYFTSNPASWQPALDALVAFLSSRQGDAGQA